MAIERGIVGKARILSGIWNLKQLLFVDRVTADAQVPGPLAKLDAVRGFEPLAFAVYQRDAGIARTADSRCQGRKFIEDELGRRIEDVIFVQVCKPLGFVSGQVGRRHW